ncbi:MAG TPA: hypothetical protein PLD10_13625 [Rhodopila sp.]|nr:hypothetical protein [Rhodopila sp.]
MSGTVISSVASSVIGFGQISHDGMIDEDAWYPFNAPSSFTNPYPASIYPELAAIRPATAGAVGLAVAIDPTAPATVKLTGAGDIVLGRCEVVEDRLVEGITIATVSTRGGMVLPIDTTPVGGVTPTPPAVGDSVQGSATPGTVMKLAAAQGRGNVVTAVTSTTCTVLFL